MRTRRGRVNKKEGGGNNVIFGTGMNPYISSILVPKIVTDGAPDSVILDLHTPLVPSAAPSQTYRIDRAGVI